MEKNSHLKDLQALGPLEIIRAELDIEGSFDEAVSGCEYAFLLAAPMNLGSSDPEVHYTSISTYSSAAVIGW
jgi:anthocyanidin reductase